MVVIGCTGTAAAPSTLVLAFPCVVDHDGEPVTAGSTTVLTKAAVRLVAPLLQPPGASFERTFAWGTLEPGTVIVVEPLVVEGEADASVETGVLRRAARLHRARPTSKSTSWSSGWREADVTPSLLGSGGAGVVRRAVGEHIVHVHLGPGLEAAHHLVQ
jgi:hypothetical protein